MTALEDLVDDMASLLDAPCTLEDPDFRLIAFSDQRRAENMDDVRRRSILERGSAPQIRDWFTSHGIQEATGPLRTPPDPELGIAARLCVPARHHGRICGYFWLLEDTHAADASLWPEATRIAEAAASLLSLVEYRQARRDALYREVVERHPGTTRPATTELAAAAGMDVHDAVCCVLVQRPDLVEQLSSRTMRSGVVWARESPTVSAAIVRADVVANASDLSGVLAALGLGRRLSTLDSATFIGVGPVVTDFDELMHARSGARVALRVSQARGSGSVVAWSELGPLGLLGVARDDDLARAIIDSQLERLFTAGSAELVETARVFLAVAGSAALAADRLGVHRQTVYHRIAQVERLIGCDLSNGEDRLRLHLALLLAPFVRS